MNTLKVLLAAGLAVTTATVALAQVEQPVNLTDVLGVRAGFTARQQPGQPKPANPVVGDDWVANFNGPVTDIAIWGSWLNDVVDPNVEFKLSIHRDNALGTGGIPFSRPGQEIWSYVGAAAQTTLAASGLNGKFYDPTSGTMGSSGEVYRFGFNNLANAFNAEAGVIYWLVVQARNTGGATSQFAWNSSTTHNTDASVFGNSSSFGNTRVVFNPVGSKPDANAGNYVDLAFTIAPEPSSFALLGLGLAALFMRRKIA